MRPSVLLATKIFRMTLTITCLICTFLCFSCYIVGIQVYTTFSLNATISIINYKNILDFPLTLLHPHPPFQSFQMKPSNSYHLHYWSDSAFFHALQTLSSLALSLKSFFAQLTFVLLQPLQMIFY